MKISFLFPLLHMLGSLDSCLANLSWLLFLCTFITSSLPQIHPRKKYHHEFVLNFFGLNVFKELSVHNAFNSITVNKEGLPKNNKKWKLFQDTTLHSELSSFLEETLIPIDLSHSVLVAITILTTSAHPFCFVSSIYSSQFFTSFGSLYITAFRLNLHV